ncbi:MAG: hypothetical protein RI947_992 [Candidatus Parcubacteria bacterium]|jgi:ornithine decarboxylase
MQLTQDVIRLSKTYKTPFLLVDLEQLRQNYRDIKSSIDNVEIFYAMKANDNPVILAELAKEGCSFEISSLQELKTVQKLNVKPEQIMCFNSIKNAEFLKEMHKHKIKVMAFDSKDEIDKIAKYAPHSELVLRVNVTNEGSEWPLTKKFGIDAVEAVPLMKYAQRKKVKIIGLTFHVGSQCLNKNNWASALLVCEEIWHQAAKIGVNLSFISLGGGIPVKHMKQIPSMKEIGDVINKSIKKNFTTIKNNLRITIEPGRGLVGDTAIMVTKVVGRAKRGTEDWLYIDAGVFNGFMETIEGFTYELKTEKNGKKKLVTIAGPSCDSVDIPFKNVMLPSVKIDDYIYAINAGAYTTVYAAPFNGFAVPEVHFINK